MIPLARVTSRTELKTWIRFWNRLNWHLFGHAIWNSYWESSKKACISRTSKFKKHRLVPMKIFKNPWFWRIFNVFEFSRGLKWWVSEAFQNKPPAMGDISRIFSSSNSLMTFCAQTMQTPVDSDSGPLEHPKAPDTMWPGPKKLQFKTKGKRPPPPRMTVKPDREQVGDQYQNVS